MRHHETKDWIDYLRGVAAPVRRAAMAAHLREGCSACRAEVDSLAALARAVREDEALEPPPHVLHCALAIFSQFRPDRVRSLPRLLARLVQDSLHDPLPAGVRSSERASRQVLYEAGTIFIDLRLEQRPGQSAVTLVGQLLQHDAGRPIARRPVVLTSGRKVVTTVASNRHGEFYVEYVPEGQMRLHIPIEEGAKRIEIPLNALAPGSRARIGAHAPAQRGTRQRRRRATRGCD